ncbi:MAG: hypothetical protein HY673_27375 [Chloroflexi bacterium]|nr:hypothetical protein [Chloroflexota bacterium]
MIFWAGRQSDSTRRMRSRQIVLVGSLVLLLGLVSRAGAARTAINIARASDTAPETLGGTFSSFGPFSLADPGIVAFQTAINPSPAQPGTTQGLFLSRKDEQGIRSLSRLVLKGDTARGAGSFYGFDTLSVNVNQNTNKVRVAFWASLLLQDGATIYEGLYLYTAGAAVKIAITGDLAPSIDPPVTFGSFGTPALNRQGQVTFWASLSDGGEGIFVYDPSAGLKLVTRNLKATPAGATGSGGSGAFQQLAAPAFNAAGKVAFLGFYSSGGLSSHGLFLYSPNASGAYDSTGSTNAVTVASSGMAKPTNWGTGGTRLSFVDGPSLSSLARIAFWGKDDQGTPQTGLILYDGPSTYTTLASSGATSVSSFGASGGAGTLTEVDNNPALNNVAGPSLNDAGMVAFWGKNSTTTGLVLYEPGPLFSPVAASGMSQTGIADGAGARKFANAFLFISSHAALPAMVDDSKVVAFWANTLDSQGAGSFLVGLFLSEESGPDLVVVKVIAPKKVRQNTNLTVTARIKNQGSASGSPETVEARFIQSDGSTSLGTPATASSTVPLAVGKARNVKVRLRAPAPVSGDCPCSVKVTVDSGGVTAEINESNNSQTVGLSIR